MIGTNKIHYRLGLTLIVLVGFMIAPSSVGTTDITLDQGPVVILDSYMLSEDSSLAVLDSPIPLDTSEKYNVVVTAYSSSVWETWGCPYTTASNTRVRDGIVANNKLPFGTEVRFPKLFGDKVFIVEDRMHYRKSDYHFDIWFPSRPAAIQFGVKRTTVEVLN